MRVPILHFNYNRSVPPLKGAYVPRIMLPLPLEKHSIKIISRVDVDAENIGMLVAKHHLDEDRWIYVHRVTSPIKRKKA